MTQRSTPHQAFEFSYATRPQPQRERSGDDDDRIRILLIGDFSGRESRRDLEPLVDRAVVPVDIDALDDLPKRMHTRIRFNEGGPLAGCDFSIDTIEDLHADRLLDLVAPLAELRSLRRRLSSGEPTDVILKELRSRGWLSGDDHTVPTERTDAATKFTDDDGESSEDTLSRLLGRPAVSGSSSSSAKGTTPAGFSDWLKQTIAPHITPARDPEHDELTRLLDDRLHEALQAALADPHFRAVESTWRSLHGLLSRVEDDALLSFRIFDVGANELREAARTGAVALPRPAGPQGWSLIVIDPLISAAEEDATLLHLIGDAVSDEAVIVAGADASHLGLDSYPDRLEIPSTFERVPAFQELSSSPLARRVALAVPPIRWRLPYGPAREPVDDLESFDEWTADSPGLIGTGSAAWPVALMLLRAATDSSLGSHAGWIDELPALSQRRGSEILPFPSTASWVSEESASRLIRAGYLPLQAAQGRGAVAILTATSIAGGQLPALDRG